MKLPLVLVSAAVVAAPAASDRADMPPKPAIQQAPGKAPAPNAPVKVDQQPKADAQPAADAKPRVDAKPARVDAKPEGRMRPKTTDATPAPAPIPVAAQAAMPSAPAPRLPGFAPRLAQVAAITSPDAWTPAPDAWQAIARSSGIDRQNARWAYARSLIGRGRGAEALGVLDLMVADDRDLAMVDSWRLARGVALTLVRRFDDAVDDLSSGGLARNPEACAWRIRAYAGTGKAANALGAIDCARTAINARAISARAPFLVAAARAAVEDGKPRLALSWLSALPDRDPAANLYRGRAHGLIGDAAPARLRLDRAIESGSPAIRTDARLTKIELAAANGWAGPAATMRQLDTLRYEWRGGEIEERALRLSYRTAVRQKDVEGALRTGATLFRFFDLVRQGPDFLPGLQAQLAIVVDPDSRMPLGRAAGLFWDYRDLLPGGAEGDLMVSKLGARLQAAGLYQRAAELFEHQLFARTVDIAQGPLSVRVASLYILAGRPDRALIAMRRTANADYPDAMLFERKRVEAVALSQLGRTLEAFAVLQDVPDAGAIRAEIAWKQHDWAKVVAETRAQLPGGGPLGNVGQAIILRRAIALAMLRRDYDLAVLRARYRAAFLHLPSAPVFTALTSVPASLDAAGFAGAMAAMPSASPAGDIAELIEAGK